MTREHIIRGGKGTLVALLASICSLNISAQQTATGTGKQSVAGLLAALHSDKWTDRASAYGSVVADQAAIQKPEVRSALLNLLDRENRQSRPGETGFDTTKGEDYAEYVSALAETVDSLVDWKNPSQVCILAHAAFDPDSTFATKLVATDRLVLPCLLQMSASTSAIDRYKAAALLVRIASGSHKLGAAESKRIREVTIAALHDQHEMVRTGTVHALAEFGAEEMIPALRQVAETDPAPEVQGYSTRKMAAQAIEESAQIALAG